MSQHQVLNQAASHPPVVPHAGSRMAGRRRGVILLIVLALLTLFTMIGLTMVLATSQARLSALSSSRSKRSGTPYQQMLSRAFHEVARGSTNKFSSVQGHSLVEDLYGAPLFVGKLTTDPQSTSGGYGQLVTFQYSNTSATNVVPNVLPNANFVFSGLVITMKSGAAAGKSARIVRDTIPTLFPQMPIPQNNMGNYWLTVTSFEGHVPSSGDEFVINGRPFSGTGFGFQMASFTTGNPIFLTGGNPTTTWTLDAMDPTPVPYTPMNVLSSAAPQYLWPYALLPNHAKFTPQNPTQGIASGGGYYTDPGGPGAPNASGVVTAGAAAAPGGANEPYDAADYQNMFLAMHYFDVNVDPTLPGTVTHPATLTPIPSFHRPALIAHWAQRAPGSLAATTTGGSVFPAAQLELQKELRRKMILRPDPQDQGFNPTTQDLNGNSVFDYREPFTDLNANAKYDTGEPFLDLNADGVWTQGDFDFTGKRFNPITGPYCIYRNPASGFETWVRDPASDWDVDNDGDGLTDSIWVDLGFEPEPGPDGKLYKPLFAVLCVDMDGKLNVNAHGTTAHLDALRYAGGQMLAPYANTGNTSGSVSTINTAGSRSFQVGEAYGPAEISLLPLLARGSANGLLEYQRLLQGAYVATATPPYYLDGRYGEVNNPNIATPDGNNNYLSNYLISGPMPGRTEQFDPYYLNQSVVQVNDLINQMMQSPLRPYLINYTPQQANLPGYFFDFITSQYNLTGGAHTPTGYGTPHNIHGRGGLLLDLRGQPYYAATTNLPWMQALANPIGVGPNATVNDAVDDPYEFDPSLNAKSDGLTVGVSGSTPLTTTIDARFTPEEVERVLRQSDSDAKSLPSRLSELAASTTSPGEKHALTGDSWDLPVPGVTATGSEQVSDLITNTTSPYLQKIFNAPLNTSLGGMSLVDLARARLMARNPQWVSSGMTTAMQYADLALFGSVQLGYTPVPVANPVCQPLLPLDFLEGLRVDINRPLGDGIDNNSNGIVDEPAEFVSDLVNYPTTSASGAAVYTNSVLADLNNDGLTSAGDVWSSDARARQLLARHLYVLMMLLVDDLNLQGQVFITPSATSVYSGLNTSSQTMNPYNASSGSVPSQQIAYLIAQWAINVVDFRDPDSICTPFEFDLSPFTDDDGNPMNGTWDVNDIVHPSNNGTLDPWSNTSLPANYANDDTSTWRGLVWGCEKPELLLTETICTHDRGTDDTNQATNVNPGGTPDTYLNDNTQGTPPDTDYDQVRRPRGTTMVEIFNPNSPLSAPQADMLQSGGAPAAAGGVNLTQYYTSTGGAVSPTWRLAIAYSSTKDEKGFYTASPGASTISSNPIDPRVPVLPANYIHRVAYFTPLASTASLAPTDVTNAWQKFVVNPLLVPTGTPVVLAPNCYALVGPASVDPRGNSMANIAATFFGLRSKANDSTVAPDGKQNSYPAYVQLNGLTGSEAVGVYNNFGLGSGPMGGGPGTPVGPYVSTVPQTNIKTVVGLPLATVFLDTNQAPVAPGGASTSLRFSVSEPEYGYPLQTGLSPNPTWDDDCFYLSGGMAAQKYPTTPFDSASDPLSINPNTYVGAPDGTIANYTTIYLQRLANPLAPWDSTANPYLTVDSMPLDLTKYTGENQSAKTTPEPSYGAGGSATMAFDARSRGQLLSGTTAGDAPNLWTPASTAPASWTSQSSVAAPLQFSTLGYLNQTYWINSAGAVTGNKSNNTIPPPWQSGFYSPQIVLNPALDNNATLRLTTMSSSTGIGTAQFNGDPLLPFPWLTWNNRPFVSQYEAMLVPTSSPSSLLSDFGTSGLVYNTGTSTWDAYSGSPYSPYNPAAGQTATSPSGMGPPAYAVPLGVFQHLLNFYDSTYDGAITRNASPPPANFFRLFEYIHVPSRFAGTQDMLNPLQFYGMSAGVHPFHPPFNWKSRYRDPGRVNLNTVFDPVVFQGIMDDYPAWIPKNPGTGPTHSWQSLWQGLIDSRRGNIGVQYDVLTGITTQVTQYLPMLPNYSLFALSGQTQFPIYPSYFANPVRPEGAATLAPPYLSPPLTYTNSRLVQSQGQSINATLLRAQAPNAYPDFSSAGSNPSFPQLNATTFDNTNSSATYSSTTGIPSRQPARNAYFQYQTQSRLGNLATNRSNVYAIWITVGYFEAVPVLPSAANPEGYQIGAEKGSDTGAFERHRAFYMFDRSVPMGFQRGKDLNVDEGILVERMIE